MGRMFSGGLFLNKSPGLLNAEQGKRKEIGGWARGFAQRRRFGACLGEGLLLSCWRGRAFRGTEGQGAKSEQGFPSTPLGHREHWERFCLIHHHRKVIVGPPDAETQQLCDWQRPVW